MTIHLFNAHVGKAVLINLIKDGMAIVMKTKVASYSFLSDNEYIDIYIY